MENNTKDNVLQYYKFLFDFYGRYHNHKETVAWAVLLLFATFFSTIILIPPEKIETGNIYNKIYITVSMLFFSCIIYKYLKSQFEYKDVGGAYSAAAGLLILEIMQEDKDKCFKEYININENPDNRYQSSYCLPKKLLDKSKEMNKKGRKNKKVIPIILPIILLLLSILNLWSPYIKDKILAADYLSVSSLKAVRLLPLTCFK